MGPRGRVRRNCADPSGQNWQQGRLRAPLTLNRRRCIGQSAPEPSFGRGFADVSASRSMIAPLVLIGLISLPIIVAFYMLRLRRRDLPVGSTFLWQQLVRDVEANAPWPRG